MRALQPTLGGYVSILRSDLSRLIYEALDGEVRTIFGDTIRAIEQDDDGVRVFYERAPVARFDLVIGAGGLHSPVRGLVFGPEHRHEKYLGYYAASFSADGYPHHAQRAYVSYAAPGRQVSRYVLRGDRTEFFLVFASNTELPVGPHDLRAQKSILRERFGQDGWELSTRNTFRFSPEALIPERPPVSSRDRSHEPAYLAISGLLGRSVGP